MCGIIGYQGFRNTKEVLLNGLKALEYRGYDSAGIAAFHKNKIKKVRVKGALESLQEKLESIDFDGSLGIGHTRWATHGRVSEQNAHPHCVNGFSIVHNGIIENYLQLREQVLASGAEIQSETDSELIAHLLAMAFDKTQDILQAVLETVPLLEGVYAVLAINEKQPDTWIAFKSGPPLVLGINPSEIFVASDIQPLMRYTNQIIYLQDDEIVKIKNTKYQIFNQKGDGIQRDPITLSKEVKSADKKDYPHFMLKEIFEQNVCIQRLILHFLNPETQTIRLESLDLKIRNNHQENKIKDNRQSTTSFHHILKNTKHIVIVACGSSYYSGLTGKHLIERVAQIPVKVELASEFRYQNFVFPDHTLFLFISQSGETADTLAALRLAKQMGKYTLAICNTLHSTIDREADACIDMSAGVEVSVASTKTFTNTITILNILALGLKKLTISDRQSFKLEKDIYQALNSLPSQIEDIFSHCDHFKEIANQIKNLQSILYMGRGINFPIALEGALKLKELAYIHAEGYAAGEMKHGPIALIDKDTKVIALIPKDDHLYYKTRSNLKEIQARGGKIIEITTDENLSEHNKNQLIKDNIYPILPKVHFSVLPILEAIVMQLIAYYTADALGNNVDRPRNLAKSVTVE